MTKTNWRMITFNVTMETFNRIERTIGGGRPFPNKTRALNAMIAEYFKNHSKETKQDDTSNQSPNSS